MILNVLLKQPKSFSKPKAGKFLAKSFTYQNPN
uniref:Uncharacterized protein n=1 Tax=Anguilla anguilla TaxID=7936 RepID=A0A0E9PBT1_ANGAN